MLFEALTTGSMLGVLGVSYYYKNNYNKDADKIVKIADACGLRTKDEGIRLYRKNYNKEGNFTEYVFKIPLGLSLDDFTDKLHKFKDGLNNRSVKRIELADFKGITLNANLPLQVRAILNRRVQLKKEIEIAYDGMLIMRVYEQGLGDYYPASSELLASCKPWCVKLGRTLHGEVVHDFEQGPHVLIGGATDMGKSNLLNLIIATLAHNHGNDVEFTLIDLKGGLEFGVYENMAQVKNFASDINGAYMALLAVQSEMSRIFDKLRHTGKKNVKALGSKKRHFVIIDESAELASAGESDKDVKAVKVACEGLIKDLARRGRASGVRLLYSTQYPTAETVPSQVKRNLVTRISLPVDTSVASLVVLDEVGAEKLPLTQGRAVYKRNRCEVMQSYHINDTLVEGVIQPFVSVPKRKEDKRVPHAVKTNATGREYTTKFEEA